MMPEIYTLNRDLHCWLGIDAQHHFSIYNLPLGIFKRKDEDARVGMALGDFVIDLALMHQWGYLDELRLEREVFACNSLNPLILLGKRKNRELRNLIAKLFSDEHSVLRHKTPEIAAILINQKEVEMLLPVKIGDYTDFYSSKEHATNVGMMFRDPSNALLPNWLHLPVGYHGRSSSIVVSETNFHRPKGQTKADDAEMPVFGASKLLDFELETAFITYKGHDMGMPISVKFAEDYIFGMVLLNDWSARDIQKWEYVPLGPFLAKNFCSSISAWVVSMDALEPFRKNNVPQVPEVLPYLQHEGNNAFDIQVEAWIQTPGGAEKCVSQTNFKHLYWSMAQQLAHHTVNGCNINAGDLMGSGTISGPTPESYGSMLEITWKGSKPVTMPDGSERKFILDGDTVILKGFADNGKYRVGFGEVKNKVLPAY